MRTLRAAVHTDGTNSGASDALVGALLECGDSASAQEELTRALGSCAPTFSRHVYLSQLCDKPTDAIAQLETALAIDSTGERGARAQCALAEALLAVAEDAPEAAGLDARAERAVAAALASGMAEIEALTALGNLRLSQGRRPEAKAAMKSAVAPMLEVLKDVREDRLERFASLPGLEIRIAVGKQLVECDMFVLALLVLDSVLIECDFNVEVWFLFALAHLRNGKVAEAREAVLCIEEVLKDEEGFVGMLDQLYLESLVEEIENAEKGAMEES